jgi:hypothetical protein
MQQWQSVTDIVAAPVSPICKGPAMQEDLCSLTSMPVSGLRMVEKIQTGISAPWKWSKEQETAHDPKSHESSCPGGQTANDPKLKENQLNIKRELTGQIPQYDLWEGCAMQCHSEWKPVKMSDQCRLLETGTRVLQHNNKTKPLQTPSTY